MKKQILIVNGPNLNLLGTREPHIYGSETFEEYLLSLQSKYKDIADIQYYQSNIEGEMINTLQSNGKQVDGIILNPAAYGHTSIALADALAAIDTPTIEVHISNIYKRESYRHHTFTSEKSLGLITGLGLKGYELALIKFLES